MNLADDAPCYLLHGWGYTPVVWETFRLLLGQSQLYVPLLRSADKSMESWADRVALNLPNASTLIGWSLGASLAMCLAARHPRKVAKLVLISATPCFVYGADWPHGLDRTTVSVFQNDFSQQPHETLQRFVALQVLKDNQRHRVSQALNASLTKSIDESLSNELRLLIDTDLRACIAHISAPCLFIHGAEDAVIPVRAAQWMHERQPSKQLAVIPKAGHAPFISQPEAVASLIRDFLHAV